MRLTDQDVVRFLSGTNSVRDGKIVGLFVLAGEVEWDPQIQLTFDVPRGTVGDKYILKLSGSVTFDYGFTSEHSLGEISFVKCLWTPDDHFYISLDPWGEEEIVSEQDADWFKSKSVSLTLEWSTQ